MSQIALTEHEKKHYARTIMLPGIGERGQRRLKAASVLIVGAGGLGSAVSLYLAAAGIGRIGIVDPDRVDLSNLQRQVIHDTERLGRLKAESARERMLCLNPHIRVDAHVDAFTERNAAVISSDYEILVDGSDNIETRYRINEVCVGAGKAYVYGAVYRFEGQASTFDVRKGPCYRCLFPESEKAVAADREPQTGVFSVLPGTVGTIQASEVLKLILGVGVPLLGRLLLYDALQMRFEEILFPRDPHCAACSGL